MTVQRQRYYEEAYVNIPIYDNQPDITSIDRETALTEVSTDSLMILTESGFVRNELGPLSNYEIWHTPSGMHVDIKDGNFKDLDELYIAREVQKSKKLGYLFLKDVDRINIDKHPIKIKYFEWCHRGNIPYMISYKDGIHNIIELHLNPRDVYLGRVFKLNAHNELLEISQNNSNNRVGYSYNGDIYKLFNTSLNETLELLPRIVNLFRDSNNLDVDY